MAAIFFAALVFFWSVGLLFSAFRWWVERRRFNAWLESQKQARQHASTPLRVIRGGH